MNNPKLSIIIPAKDEEKRIITTLESIKEYMTSQNYEYEVIVVENQSTDKTSEVTEQFAREHMPQLSLMSLKFDCGGKGCAVKKGVLDAKGDYIVFMDADNATRISEIGNFWQYFDQGYNVVIGSRHVKGAKIEIEQPWYRQIIGRSANLLIQLLVLPGIKDTQCGFKAFSNKVGKDIFSIQEIEGWGFDIEILSIAKKWGNDIKEVPVNWYHVGESRLRPIKAATDTLRDLLKVRIGLWQGKYNKEKIIRQ